MLHRSVLWFATLVAIVALCAVGLATASETPTPETPAPAAVYCQYLPVVALSTQAGAQAAPQDSPQPAAVAAGACTTGATPPPPPPPPPPDPDSAVQLRPAHRVIESERQPIQYVVVLDQSASMSANFKGQCDHDSSANPNPPLRNFPGEPARFWQCTNGPLYDTNGDGIGDTAVTDRAQPVGSTYYWANRNERRITVAKKGVETLIRQTNMSGNSGFSTSQPPDQMALVWFNDRVQRNGNNEVFANGGVFTSSPNELISKMWSRTTDANGDPYRTSGGTNATAGLYRASLILDAAPSQVVFNGRTYTYKRVVLLITDGVTSNFFHPSRSDLYVAQSTSGTYPITHPCRNLGVLVIEDADCQTTEIGGTYTTREFTLDRPMTQLAKVSQDTLQPKGYNVFVVALGPLQPSVLSSAVPSFPNYFRDAPTLQTNADGTTNVDTIMRAIDAELTIVVETCRAVTSPTWVGAMGQANRPTGNVPAFPTVGEVRLVNQATQVSYLRPIVASAEDGTLSYTITNVPAGTYTLSARLWYRGADGITRVYEALDNQGTPVASRTVTLTGNETSPPTVALRFDGNVCSA